MDYKGKENMITFMLIYAESLLGAPYIWGGNGPFFDCSGYAQEVLASVGIDPPGDQTAQALHDHIKKKNWPTDIVEGSILFYGRDTKHISHVAIVKDEHFMLEAGGGNSKTLTVEDAVKQGAMVRQRPIRKNFIAVFRPQFS